MKLNLNYILFFVGVLGFLQAYSLQNPGQLSFKENKGQVSDQFYKPRPDVLFSGSGGKINFHLRNNGISYQLSRLNNHVPYCEQGTYIYYLEYTPLKGKRETRSGHVNIIRGNSK